MAAVTHLTRRPSVAAPGAVGRIIGAIVGWTFGGLAAAAPLLVLGPIGLVLGGIVWLGPLLLAGPLLAGTLLEATAGEDGVHVRSFGRDHWVAYAQVSELRVDGARIALVRRDGSTLHLQLMGKPGRHGAMPVSAADGTTFVAAIQRGVERARLGRTAPPMEHELARGPRTDAAWTDATIAAARRPVGFRDEALDPAVLLRVASDPDAVPSARAAGALALRAGGNATELGAIRDAARSTAHPRVRVALETAANERTDVEAVRRAVARVP